MSLEDVFGSDLDDSEDEEAGKSDSEAAKKAQIDELFGDSPSEGEEETEEQDKNDEERSDEESGDERESIRNSDDDKGKADIENEQDTDEIIRPSTKEKVSHADLFGEDDELSSDDEKEEEREEVEAEPRVEQEESQQRVFREDGEEEELEEEETRIDVTIPYCRVPLGSELYFSKLPNFLSLETKPYDPTLYEDDVEDDEILDEEGRSRLKLKVENTIRWRCGQDADGNEIKESNARVVRWSDGSLSLLVGQEVFDIQKTAIDGNFNHLFVQQGTGLQGQALFKEKLTFRPHSTASQTHRKMTLSIADRAAKAQKIRILPSAGQDPEASRSDAIKKEDERLRSQLRLENQQRRMRERSQARGLNSSYLEAGEDDEEELEQSLLKIKKKFKDDLAKGAYSSEEEDEEDEAEEVGGLESDMEEEGEERLLNAKEGRDKGDEFQENASRKRTSSEGSIRKEKKKTKKIIESSDEESD